MISNKQQTIMNYNCSFIRFFPEYLVSFIPFYFSTKSQLKTNDKLEKYYNSLYSHNIKHCCWLINKNKMLNNKFVKYYKKLSGKHLFTNNYYRQVNEYDYYNLNQFKCNLLFKCHYIEYLKSVLYHKNNEKNYFKLTHCFSHVISRHQNDIKNFNLIKCKNKLNRL